MFNWFRKKEKISKDSSAPERKVQDKMEECLWEIKEEYDLPTEEVDSVVNSKRRNVDYMHKQIIKRRKDV